MLLLLLMNGHKTKHWTNLLELIPVGTYGKCLYKISWQFVHQLFSSPLVFIDFCTKLHCNPLNDC